MAYKLHYHGIKRIRYLLKQVNNGCPLKDFVDSSVDIFATELMDELVDAYNHIRELEKKLEEKNG